MSFSHEGKTLCVDLNFCLRRPRELTRRSFFLSFRHIGTYTEEIDAARAADAGLARLGRPRRNTALLAAAGQGGGGGGGGGGKRRATAGGAEAKKRARPRS